MDDEIAPDPTLVIDHLGWPRVYRCRAGQLRNRRSPAVHPGWKQDRNSKSSTTSLRFLYSARFTFSAGSPALRPLRERKRTGSHPDHGCYPGFGVAVGSARASLNIAVAISTKFRPPSGLLFSRIHRWPPTYAHLVWQNADPGTRTRLSLARLPCPPTRNATDSLEIHTRSGLEVGNSPGQLVKSGPLPEEVWPIVAIPRGIDQ